MVFEVVVFHSCGLAALAMAGQLLTGSSLDADRLLWRAVDLCFSFHGEMFSGQLFEQQLFVLLSLRSTSQLW